MIELQLLIEGSVEALIQEINLGAELKELKWLLKDLKSENLAREEESQERSIIHE